MRRVDVLLISRQLPIPLTGSPVLALPHPDTERSRLDQLGDHRRCPPRAVSRHRRYATGRDGSAASASPIDSGVRWRSPSRAGVVAGEPVRDVDLLLEVVAQREVEERAAQPLTRRRDRLSVRADDVLPFSGTGGQRDAAPGTVEVSLSAPGHRRRMPRSPGRRLADAAVPIGA
jgi:hypothetical protein